jgi:hypothetical protein
MTSATNPHARRLVLPVPDARPHAVFSSAWGHPFDGLAGPACVADVRAANTKPAHPFPPGDPILPVEVSPALLGREARHWAATSRPSLFSQER